MGDRGDVVLGWLTKLVIGFAVVGVLGFDLVAIGAARFQAEDHAQAAVRAAHESYRSGGKDLQKAYEAALADAAGHGDTVEPRSFTIAPDGTITLTLHRGAATMLVKRVAPLRSWTDVEVTVSARPAT